MTKDEATKILLMLRAAYPNADGFIDERSAAARETLYRRKLLALHFKLATEAVERVIDECPRYPAWAEFRSRYNDVRIPRPELKRGDDYALPGVDETIVDSVQVREMVARVSRKLGTPEPMRRKSSVLAPPPSAGIPAEEIERIAAKAPKAKS